jgi:hypothetical protein
MFGFLKRYNARILDDPALDSPSMRFEDSTAAFAYGCQHMQCPLSVGAGLPAIVLDAREVFGADAAVQREPDGKQIAVIRVASSDGGFIVNAITVGSRGPALDPGQLVWWLAIRYVADIADCSQDRRFGWLGVILSTLKPEYLGGSWTGDDKFSS